MKKNEVKSTFCLTRCYVFRLFVHLCIRFVTQMKACGVQKKMLLS